MEFVEEFSKSVNVKNRFWKKDKYERPMFEVADSRLDKLYEECQKNNKGISLFKVHDSLMMIISNFNDTSLENYNVKLVDFNGNFRFYANLKKDTQDEFDVLQF